MNKIPRASMSITILTDEDFRLLVSTRGGTEAFGVFVALVLAGRERLQQGQATQIPGTESLRLDNSQGHILALTHLAPEQLADALKAISSVAKKTGGDPWVYADKKGHLVIRSFFKFNAPENRGGARPGAGRPPKGGGGENQTEFNLNTNGKSNRIQNGPRSEINLKSNAGPSVSVSVSVPDPSSEVKTRDARRDDAPVNSPAPEPTPEPAPEPTTKADPGSTPEQTQPRRGDAKYEPPFPVADDMLEPTAGRHEIAEADARRIWSMVYRLTGKHAVCQQWFRKQRFHSAAVWVQAVQELYDSGIGVYALKLIDMRAGDIEVRKPDERGRRNGRPAAPRPTSAADVPYEPGSVLDDLRANMLRDLERESGPREDAPR